MRTFTQELTLFITETRDVWNTILKLRLVLTLDGWLCDSRHRRSPDSMPRATCCSATVCVSKPHTFIRKSETRSGPWRHASRWPDTESLLQSGTTLATDSLSSIARSASPL